MQKVITVETYTDRIPVDPGYAIRHHEAIDDLLAGGWRVISVAANYANQNVYVLTFVLEKGDQGGE